MIEAVISGLVGSWASTRLLQFVRPRRKSEFDAMGWDQMTSRNQRIETGATVVFVLAFLAAFAGLVTFGVAGEWWRVGVYFCGPVTLFILFIAAATLQGGVRRFNEFWRYHELKHRIHLGLLLALYLPIAAIGIGAGAQGLHSIGQRHEDVSLSAGHAGTDPACDRARPLVKPRWWPTEMPAVSPR